MKKYYICNICNKKFKSFKKHQEHVLTHIKNKPVIKEGNLDLAIKLDVSEYDIMSTTLNKNCINLGKKLRNDLAKLSETEFSAFISECITHEVIHQVIFNMFDFTTSQLYDLIGHHLYNSKKLMKKAFNNIDSEYNNYINSYVQNLNIYGLKSILFHWDIDNNDLNQAYIITNKRLKNE